MAARSIQLFLQSLCDIWPSGPVPIETPHTMVKGHAKAYDLEPFHQWRSALSLHTNAKKPYSAAGESILDTHQKAIL